MSFQILSARVVLAAVFCAASAGVAVAEIPFVPHSDDEIARFIDFKGPTVNAKVADVWRDMFLGARTHRAFAVSPGGSGGYSTGQATPEKASENALKFCAEREASSHRENACALYAVDSEIVYPDAKYQLRPIAFQVGDFTSKPEYFYRGPERAKGVVVWQHGYSNQIDQRKSSAYSITNRMNLMGWDILRFDRDPAYDKLWWAVAHLESSLPLLKSLGYKRIVLAGQSRGAIQSLHVLENDKIAPLVDGVFAGSPSENGTGSNSVLSAPDEWRTIVERLPRTPRVAIAFFAKDPYNPAAEDEAKFARATFAARGQPAITIYETDPQMLTLTDREGNPSGHYGVGSRAFADAYAACLETFFDTGEKTSACAKF